MSGFAKYIGLSVWLLCTVCHGEGTRSASVVRVDIADKRAKWSVNGVSVDGDDAAFATVSKARGRYVAMLYRTDEEFQAARAFARRIEAIERAPSIAYVDHEDMVSEGAGMLRLTIYGEESLWLDGKQLSGPAELKRALQTQEGTATSLVVLQVSPNDSRNAIKRLQFTQLVFGIIAEAKLPGASGYLIVEPD